MTDKLIDDNHMNWCIEISHKIGLENNKIMVDIIFQLNLFVKDGYRVKLLFTDGTWGEVLFFDWNKETLNNVKKLYLKHKKEKNEKI